SLSAKPAYHTRRSIERSTSSRPVHSSANSATLASIISATRSRTWPRLVAVADAHVPCAARAADTASRTSFRDARATFWPCDSYVRPLSDRGNAPPMKSLYVFFTGMRAMPPAGVSERTGHQDVVDVLAVEMELPAEHPLDDEAGPLVQPPRRHVSAEHAQRQPPRPAPPRLLDR